MYDEFYDEMVAFSELMYLRNTVERGSVVMISVRVV